MPATRHTTHVVEPVYATPVIRAPSPAESINTEYGRDESSVMDADVDDEEFARRTEEQIGLRRTTWAEAGPPKPVILPRTKDAKEEQMMFERVMKNLREKVKELEDEELYDTIIQQNPGPAFFTPEPSSRDIETIMRSMLPSSKPAQSSSGYPASHISDHPSSYTIQISRMNGESSGATVTGPRYPGNLSRNQ
ncbi:uncharacterized protein FOMMEDRAFT_31482 [Fomitiporia mediterranea MF3/22]|uniref:uncharacterized protein n=1 Tax=Fomitiporia mediterranea (strain MF3/22) TaxID=694068 RepID=UPI0004408983|nr:uncharacterized protein FOMMEDRAFT_31482 [Fomitiporia mediterranea MF3/22]EJC98899.1 hypothetical protein FOMMEDRAFT_31482 [Fomitiporia mediterranea MF3/22]